MSGLEDRIVREGERIGFDAIGFTSADPSPRADHLHRWLAEGMHGGMQWMARDPARRIDPRRVLSGASSVVMCGLSYRVEEPPPFLWDDPLRGRFARYAWGLDYHDVLLPMLEQLASYIRTEAGTDAETKCYVDTGPLLERDLAERAGLGFIGKNTLLIHERMGSMLFLGAILVNVPLRNVEPDRVSRGTCGQCRRCQTVCPTHAFPVPYVLDARLCISYLTIELKGSIPEQLRPLLGNWIYGCDACQTACPWVIRFPGPGRARFLRADPDVVAPKLDELIALDDQGFRDRFHGTPVMRTKRRGLLRNVCVALGNSRRREAIPWLEAAAQDAEPLIREHAGWAIRRLAETAG